MCVCVCMRACVCVFDLHEQNQARIISDKAHIRKKKKLTFQLILYAIVTSAETLLRLKCSYVSTSMRDRWCKDSKKAANLYIYRLADHEVHPFCTTT